MVYISVITIRNNNTTSSQKKINRTLLFDVFKLTEFARLRNNFLRNNIVTGNYKGGIF